MEDLGVVPDTRYLMTLNDVLNHNVDLIAAAAKMLAGMKTQVFRLKAPSGTPVQQLTFESKNIDRVDMLVNDRPVVSQDVTDGIGTLTLPTPAPAGSTLACNGYRSGSLVASTRLLI